MTSTRGSSRSQRSRKSNHTYSLTVDGDSYRLLSHSSSPACAMATVRTPTSPSPSGPTSEECNMRSQTFSPVVSSSRLYMPYIPVPRGPPRSFNLYVYPPTGADYARARKRSISKAAAAEDARKEREDDERRRNIILGIAVPRKSTRRTRSTANVAPEQDGPPMAAENSPSIERRGRKGRRVAIKGTKSVVQSELVIGAASTSTVSPSISLVSLAPSSEALSSAKKSRRKPPPKSNAKPTPRLTTRSQAKAKATMIRGEERDTRSASIAASEVGDPGTIDVEIENPEEPSSVARPLLNARTLHKRAATVSKLGSLQLRLEDNDNRTSLSGDSSLPSFDTLCDNTEHMPDDFPKESLFPIVGETVLNSDVLLPSSEYSSSTASMGRSASPPFTTVTSLTASATTADKIVGDKRKLEETETESKSSLQTQCRRSSRVPKKRKLH